MIQGEVQAKNALGTKEWLHFKVGFDNANDDYAIDLPPSPIGQMSSAASYRG